jgi:hypothetical protein
VNWYKSRINEDPLARMIEAWMFPAWTGDIASDRPPVTPRQLLLVRTGQEVVDEISVTKYSDAYLCYLAEIYLPIARVIDPTVGGHLRRIAEAFSARFESNAPSSRLEESVKSLRIEAEH